jgi:hypothetical protein
LSQELPAATVCRAVGPGACRGSIARRHMRLRRQPTWDKPPRVAGALRVLPTGLPVDEAVSSLPTCLGHTESIAPQLSIPTTCPSRKLVLIAWPSVAGPGFGLDSEPPDSVSRRGARSLGGEARAMVTKTVTFGELSWAASHGTARVFDARPGGETSRAALYPQVWRGFGDRVWGEGSLAPDAPRRAGRPDLGLPPPNRPNSPLSPLSSRDGLTTRAGSGGREEWVRTCGPGWMGFSRTTGVIRLVDRSSASLCAAIWTFRGLRLQISPSHHGNFNQDKADEAVARHRDSRPENVAWGGLTARRKVRGARGRSRARRGQSRAADEG